MIFNSEGSREDDKDWLPWPCELFCKVGSGQMFGKSITRSSSVYWFGKRKIVEFWFLESVKNRLKNIQIEVILWFA